MMPASKETFLPPGSGKFQAVARRAYSSSTAAIGMSHENEVTRFIARPVASFLSTLLLVFLEAITSKLQLSSIL
jgi:hypothetical protein